MDFTFIEDLSLTTKNRQKISFYPDDYSTWHEVYTNNALTCQQRVDQAKLSFPLSNLADTRYNGTYGYDVVSTSDEWRGQREAEADG